KRPIALHEANAKPGIANRLGSVLTRQVGVAFEATRLRNARFVGMPLRREIEQLDRHTARAEAFEFFGLDPARMTLLVTGGSLGARRINETIAASSPALVGTGWQLLHVTGERGATEVSTLDRHHTIPYCDRMDLA